MLNFDLRGIVVAGLLLGVALGSVVVGAVVLGWPYVWAWLKPVLHAATA